MTDGKMLIEELLQYAKCFLYLSELDEVYTRNLLLGEFGYDAPSKDDINAKYISQMKLPDELYGKLCEFAVERGLCKPDDADVYATYVFGILTPKPSEVNLCMRNLREKMGAKAACEYLYNLSIKNNYVRKSAIDKNFGWEYADGDKKIEITVNLSKPEKDNKDIKKLAEANTSDKYPECVLCRENEGYRGASLARARANLRLFEMTVGGQRWFMQYSPYAYFYQHCILLSAQHSPMKITRDTVEKLFDFIEYVPHYFIGSNADLPIVGGSILNHEHYQGGYYELPVHKAKIRRSFRHENYPDVEIGQVDWYNSVIRLSGFNRNTVCELAGAVIENWKQHSNPEVGIIADENGVRHNTCTLAARFLPDNRYSLDIILRNNRADEQYPDGIFHAHPEHHNIKKEGIGIIEAMGLFILPGRLEREFSDIADIMTGKVQYDKQALSDPAHPLYAHRFMIEKLMSGAAVKDEEQAKRAIQAYVNKTCAAILGDTAVFKRDAEGVSAFNKFLLGLGIR